LRGTADYPAGLERLPDPPTVLFALGRVPVGAVAVVGTREPSAWGLAEAGRFGAVLAEAGLPLLNGLAAGVDKAALEAALGRKGLCVGVLASGHADPHASAGSDVSERILAAGGTLVSEYPPGIPAHKGSFIQRDRIQAGMSAAVVVVETRAEGGTMHTVLAAEKAGVPLYALFPQDQEALAGVEPGKLTGVQQGTWGLLRSGRAKRARSAREWVAGWTGG
jgi:DNA processing protein